MRSLDVVVLAAVAVLTVNSSRAVGQAAPTDSTPRVSVGGFVDGYYAWDFGRPVSRDRSFAGGTPFTTQPARHNEFNVNLAFVELKLEAPHYRGRLALQTGTSVQSNYSGEPTTGTVSGPSLSRVVQEAVVGVQLKPTLWVDAGIFFSHMGMEGWISRDNPTYTRSLVAEYSPYYQSGAKLTWMPSAKVTAQLNVVNGWQNISENNQGKGAGIRVDVQPNASTTLSYYNFVSQESGTRLRTFNGVGMKQTRGRVTLLGEIDGGTQSRGTTGVTSDGTSSWLGGVAIVRVQTTPRVALSLRAEGYADRDQVIIATGAIDDVPNAPFRGAGGSIGVDVAPYPRVLWRSELRALHTKDAIFPNGSNAARSGNALVVTSLALTF
jgi:hypothetical protein